MAALDDLVAELDRSYAEAQERMSDPAVYNDHREAADVGRRLKELEQPYKLAREWKAVSDDLAAARDDADLRELVPDLEGALDRGLALTPPGGELVLLPTYTAMLGLQQLLAARGLTRPYWERSA